MDCAGRLVTRCQDIKVGIYRRNIEESLAVSTPGRRCLLLTVYAFAWQKAYSMTGRKKRKTFF